MKTDYKELTEAPVSEGTQTAGDASAVPKVEELTEEEYEKEKAKEKKNSKSKKNEQKEANAAPICDPNDID